MLHLHRSNRADGLVEALRELLEQPPPDPFAPEVVSVPTRGMERWIAQQLSGRLGVCANVLFPSPRRLVGDAVAAASGVDPDTDPWLPERSVWPLLDVVDECLAEPWLHLLAGHFGANEEAPDPQKRSRRFATVRHVADLFDGYALHRPDMVRAWATGDGDGEWQARLWRCLRARIDSPGPAERLAGACDVLRGDAGAVDLPPRLSIFGLTRLPAGYRDILEALAARRDVHLFLLHPSPALWDKVRAAGARPALRADDATATLAENRLLASWGRDAREMQLVLSSAEHVDHHHPVKRPAGTLLERVQADVRGDATPPVPAPLDPADRSIEVHACHGRARQVEVLRDAILHLLAADESLEPRDVIVMCPDIETFAPLVHATFGAAAPDDEAGDDPPPEEVAPDLRVRLADRALRQTNPVLGVVSGLLELADDRVSASQVLDLAGRDPVRRRFGFDDDALARLEEWVSESGVRWGLDARHRAAFRLQGVEQGTWRAGLQRVLVGVTMTEDERRLVGGVLPLDDVDSSAIDLAGRFAELVDRLEQALDALAAPKPVAAWAQTIAHAADLLTRTTERDAWQRTELDRMLAELDDQAGAENPQALALAEVRALLHERLQGRPTRANFRTGHLTFCTLVPMRSVPHRVVCLLGLDDAIFPRKAPRDGDDLRLEHPRVGERDPRSEDRQLLLDAVMAAEERLLITYTGNDERTNAVLKPAVPVGELLDVVDRTAVAAGNRRASEAIVVRHPLQPFDPRNFVEGELIADRPWSFDRVTLAGARRLTDERHDPPPFLRAPLARLADRAVELDDLLRFAGHPVRAFLRQRLGLTVGDFSTEIEDALPVELDALEKWGVGQRMLDARLEGCDARAVCLAEMRRGQLPPGVLGQPVINDLFATVERIVGHAHAVLGTEPATSADVRVELPDGRVLTGTVTGLRGDAVQTTTFSRVGAKHRLTAWVRLLALTAAHPDPPREAVTIGRGQDDAITVARVPALTGEQALRELQVLVDLHDRALREPLPMACKTSAAYAGARRAGGDAERAARNEWESGRFDREDAEPEHVLAFGGRLPFEELIGAAPRDDERGHGWDPEEPTRFGRLAVRLWTPLLDVEERREL